MENISYIILAINPGSTSTKIAVFEDETPFITEKVSHSAEELKPFDRITDQFMFRKDLILNTLRTKNFNMKRLNAVVGRGGLIRPVESGTYVIDEYMLEDLKSGYYGEHASNLGGLLAYEIGKELGIPSFIVDPVVVDELESLARITGLPEIERRSIFHALNQKAVARKVASIIGKNYNELNIIVAHLGGGITVGAHKKGRVVDVNNGLDGEGPFSPERSGRLPVLDLVRMFVDRGMTYADVKKKIAGSGGLVAHLGTNDTRTVRAMIEQGDERARLVFEAMAYQVAREIGACAAALEGQVDAIVLTGGLAYDEGFVNWIKRRVAFIARIYVFPGEDELEALAQGALRVLKGMEEAKRYAQFRERKEALTALTS
ncbi:MAG: butyrate kinase [Thermoanaerobacteraceae bacterium]|nr:butyrate kinase [Thermoanaerobacteraceae bacterium]